MDPELIFRHLAAEGVDYVLIGGFAAVVHGTPHVTQDIDLAYSPEPTNLAKLARALTPLHPYLRVEGLSDEEARALPFRLDERTLRQTGMLTLGTDAGDLDIMSQVEGLGAYVQVKAAAIEAALFGTPVWVLDLPGIIASKRAAGREKDLLALPNIEATLRRRQQRQQGT